MFRTQSTKYVVTKHHGIVSASRPEVDKMGMGLA